MTKLLTNQIDRNVLSEVNALALKATSVQIATAFFSEDKLLRAWAEQDISVELIVSLRPPTNYNSLKAVQPIGQIITRFLGTEFHSKFFIFRNEDGPFAAIIGSSNFTHKGLSLNIETNVLVKDAQILKALSNHFNELKDKSNSLTPQDLEVYRPYWEAFQKRRKAEKDEIARLEKAMSGRMENRIKVKPIKLAKEYLKYWQIVDDIKSIVEEQSEEKFPKIPVYFVLDNFWHWLTTSESSEKLPRIGPGNKAEEIQKIFAKYLNSPEKDDIDYNPRNMWRVSRTIFQKYLSETNIDNLTKDEADEVFVSLHSNQMRLRRTFIDESSFSSENSIKDIRRSLKYLLYSEEDIDVRIHNVLRNPKYQLGLLGDAGVQELNGWVSPAKYPIRNGKADKAVLKLGYSL